MKKLKSLFILAISLLLILSACNSNIPSETPNEPNTPDLPVEDQGDEAPVSYDNEIRKFRTFYTPTKAVVDGKVLLLTRNMSHYQTLRSITDKINTAVCIHCGRFVECSDGTFIDICETSQTKEDYPTSEVLKDLNEKCGIWRIEVRDYLINIYANDGTLYSINEVPHEILGSDYDGGYLEYLESDEYLKKEDRLTTSKYDKEHILESEGEKNVLFSGDKVVLNANGTVSCDSSDIFENWTDVKDIVSCGNIVLGLKNDGTLLTYGTDFFAENVARIDIINDYGYNPIPVALTADGKLIFGEYPELEVSDDPNEPPYEIGYEPFPYQYAIKQAENFTDVVDFTYIYGSRFIILVQKSDGSLWATYNDYYDPEYVNILGRDEFFGNE